MPPSPASLSLPNPLTYWGMVYGGLALVRLLRAGWHVEGVENFPSTGPVIVAANHINWIDPPLIIAASPRRIVFLAKEELETGVRGKLLGKAVGWLTIKRGTPDRTALRGALDVLKRGWPLGIFPEGTRSSHGVLQAAHPGTAMLALWSGAPVLPVGVWGSYGFRLPRDFLARPQFHIRYGTPMVLRDADFAGTGRDRLVAATDLIMQRIAALLPPEMRGVYADASACTPALAQQED